MNISSIDRYLKASYPGRKPKPKFKVGQMVRFNRVWNYISTKGRGTIRNIFPAYGNVPVRYYVDGFTRGVLFEYELKNVKGKQA